MNAVTKNCGVAVSKYYLWPHWNRDLENGPRVGFVLLFPIFSVTIHSFTRLASKSEMIAALVRWRDMTFSKRIQKTSRSRDLLFSVLFQDGDGCWNVKGYRLWKVDFRDQNACWNNHTLIEEGHPVCNYLFNIEECVNEVNLLPDRHALHNKTSVLPDMQ